MDCCFAVREGDTQLYSILARVTSMVPDSVTNAALTFYSSEDVKTSLTDMIAAHLGQVMSVVAAVMTVIVFLLLRSIRAERKASAERQKVSDLNRRVFVDELTAVRNKGAYADMVQELQRRVDSGEKPEFAVAMFDCNNLKKINDQYGHDKGDEYLKGATRLICRVFQHSPVFRVGGDEFTVVMENTDYQNRAELLQEFERTRAEISAAAENPWEEVHIAVGVAAYDPQLDEVVVDTVRRADRSMYENKRIVKARGR